MQDLAVLWFYSLTRYLVDIENWHLRDYAAATDSDRAIAQWSVSQHCASNVACLSCIGKGGL